jgi:hypothetical protein
MANLRPRETPGGGGVNVGSTSGAATSTSAADASTSDVPASALGEGITAAGCPSSNRPVGFRFQRFMSPLIEHSAEYLLFQFPFKDATSSSRGLRVARTVACLLRQPEGNTYVGQAP